MLSHLLTWNTADRGIGAYSAVRGLCMVRVFKQTCNIHVMRYRLCAYCTCGAGGEDALILGGRCPAHGQRRQAGVLHAGGSTVRTAPFAVRVSICRHRQVLVRGCMDSWASLYSGGMFACAGMRMTLLLVAGAPSMYLNTRLHLMKLLQGAALRHAIILRRWRVSGCADQSGHGWSQAGSGAVPDAVCFLS